jgi:hypothetical protein
VPMRGVAQAVALIGLMTRPETMQPARGDSGRSGGAGGRRHRAVLPRGNDGVGTVGVLTREVSATLRLTNRGRSGRNSSRHPQPRRRVLPRCGRLVRTPTTTRRFQCDAQHSTMRAGVRWRRREACLPSVLVARCAATRQSPLRVRTLAGDCLPDQVRPPRCAGLAMLEARS